MNFEEAYITLCQNSTEEAPLQEKVKEARSVLKSEFGKRHKWKDFDKVSSSKAAKAFVREFTGDNSICVEELPLRDWMDLWIDSERRPVAITFHNNWLGSTELRLIVNFTDKYGLQVNINGDHSWRHTTSSLIVFEREYETTPSST